MFPFHAPRKHQEIFAFLVFSGGTKWKPWLEMGQNMIKRGESENNLNIKLFPIICPRKLKSILVNNGS